MTYPALIAEIEAGKVKIPQFQREFVWSIEKSAALIDSILRGYPIGTFIFWRTKESLRSVRNIGGIQLKDTPEGEYANQVLDGQQRLTSLFASIRGVKIEQDGGSEDFADIRINLRATDDQPIVIVGNADSDPKSTVRLVDLVNGGMSFLTQFPKEYWELIDQYSKRLATFLFSIVLVKDAPIEVATEIFTRINEGGKPLTPFEIMIAKTYIDGEFDLGERCDEMEEILSKAEFETIPPVVFLQLNAVLIAKDCRKKTILGLNKQKFVETWKQTDFAIRAAVDYVKSNLSIPASRLLPYPNLLVPMGYFFAQRKNGPKDDGERSQLNRLFWQVALSGRYSGSTETEIAADVRRIDEILACKEPDYPTLPDIDVNFVKEHGRFSTGRALVKTMLCVLAAQNPRDFDDHALVKIDNDWLIQANSKNYHHFFPKAFLKKKGVERSMINHIANITIIGADLNKRVIKAKAPSSYLADFKKTNKKLRETLATHLIDLDNDGVMDDDFETFFIHRCEAISRRLKTLVTPA
jgi:hypothetical protein